MKSVRALLIYLGLFIWSLVPITSIAQLSNVSLRVNNPQSWWQNDKGTIEKATIAIRPKGAFSEIGLYLELSAKETDMYNANNIEIVMDFDVPKEAVFHDSWLWIDDTTIVKAKLLDVWTAREIYEDIVDRRRDPSVLYKFSPTRYQLRIYPLMAQSMRKVKLTYLVPNQLLDDVLSVTIPIHFINASKILPDMIYLLGWKEENAGLPTILGVKDNPFVEKVDGEYGFGNYYRANIPKELYDADLIVHFPTKENTLNTISSYKDGDELYYQSVISPGTVFSNLSKKNVLLLLDNTEFNSSLTKAQLYQLIQAATSRFLTASDSINVMVASNTIKPVFDEFRPYNAELLDSVLNSTTLLNYTNLHPTLFAAVNYLNEVNKNAAVVVISNSFTFSGFTATNSMVNDLKAAMEQSYSFHVIDFQNRNISYVLNGTNNQYFYGNEYVYLTLTNQTNGFYKAYRNDGDDAFYKVMEQIGGSIQIADVDVDFSGGFAYSIYNNVSSDSKIGLNQPITSVGKYLGNLPATFTISGLFDGSPISKEITLTENNILSTDSTIKKFWAGAKVMDLEQKTQTNEVIADIIATSLNSRVMSKYTSFICLEPSLGGEVCQSCQDESKLTSIFDSPFELSNDSTFTAYPNPFNSSVALQLTLPSNTLSSQADVLIYNVNGQLVQKMSLPIGSDRVVRFRWDGRGTSGTTLSTGNYFIQVKAGQHRFLKKVLMIK